MNDQPTPFTDAPEKPGEGSESPAHASQGTKVPDDAQETFSRAYVQKLRNENAAARTKAQRADELATRLLASTVRDATRGILADPTDLALSDDFYGDDGFPDAKHIAEAARELVARKPHLADRRPAGPVEQGPREQPKNVNLAGIVRSLAG